MKKMSIICTLVAGVACAYAVSAPNVVGSHASSLMDQIDEIVQEAENAAPQPELTDEPNQPSWRLGLDSARALVERGKQLSTDLGFWTVERDGVRETLRATRTKWKESVEALKDPVLKAEHDGFRKTHERLAKRQYTKCNEALEKVAKAVTASEDLANVIVSYEAGEAFGNGREHLAAIAGGADNAASEHLNAVKTELAKFRLDDEDTRLANKN